MSGVKGQEGPLWYIQTTDDMNQNLGGPCGPQYDFWDLLDRPEECTRKKWKSKKRAKWETASLEECQLTDNVESHQTVASRHRLHEKGRGYLFWVCCEEKRREKREEKKARGDAERRISSAAAYSPSARTEAPLDAADEEELDEKTTDEDALLFWKPLWVLGQNCEDKCFCCWSDAVWTVRRNCVGMLQSRVNSLRWGWFKSWPRPAWDNFKFLKYHLWFRCLCSAQLI